ncbi:Disease resistance-like protein DSC2, partial [Glycine soja]
VLIVLDGMDSLDSLESLCSEFGDQYRYSRLIITTRNRKLLDGKVERRYKGTDAIQGIALNLSLIKDLLLHADTFTKMKTLRFLKFHNTLGQSSSNTYLDLPATLEPFSDQLRYIEWIGYPFQSPSPFFAKFLVEIPMPHSKLKQLWQGIQELDYLQEIELGECKQFEEVPDLSKAPVTINDSAQSNTEQSIIKHGEQGIESNTEAIQGAESKPETGTSMEKASKPKRGIIKPRCLKDFVEK